MKGNVARELEAARVPPHSIEAEQAVLGGIMLDNESWERIADKVVESDFYRNDHQIIFRALATLRESDRPCDAVTLGEWLESNELTEEVGGLGYLIELTNNTPSAVNITAYAEIVRERSILRQLLQISSETADSCYRPEGRSSHDLLEEAEQRVFRIREAGGRSKGDFVGMKEGVKDAFELINHLYQLDGNITGIPTGFTDFDAKTAGLQRTDLIIVAGRPAMGKTTFAMNIAQFAAISSGARIAVFSMEMSAQQLILRLLSSLGHIDQQALRTGRLRDEDMPRLNTAMNMLVKAKLFVDETPALSPIELRARARRLARQQQGLDMIVIDYLQLMQVPGNSENRATEISEISRSLKALAKELEVPVIALSQLNRSLEQRPNKRPIMADLRESGAIEQDADLIIFIYRDEVYNPDSAEQGKAEIILGKHRNGSTGMIPLVFRGKYTRFDNFTREEYPISAAPE